MSDVSPDAGPPKLNAGDRVTWSEYTQALTADAGASQAELLGGQVFLPAEGSYLHARLRQVLAGLVFSYEINVPRVRGAINGLVRLGDQDALRPDLLLWRTKNGGARVEGWRLAGAPELVMEICPRQTAIEVHDKRACYERAGVNEYLCFLLEERELRVFRQREGVYQETPLEEPGVFRSEAFPGLWLDPQALFEDRCLDAMLLLDQGLGSAEAQAFVRLSATW